MQNPRKYQLNWFKILLIGMSSYVIYLCVNQQYQLNLIDRESEKMRVQLTELQQVNETLKGEQTALNDKAYVEKLAREELGLVKPGEIPYIVSGKK